MLTSGVLAQHPIAGRSIVRTVNGAIEAFARSALPAADVALRYMDSVEGSMNGRAIAATARAA